MKVLIQFSNSNNKSEIITPFIGLDNCQITDDNLVVPGIIKITFDNDAINCYCLGLDVAEKILSNVCGVEVDSEGNNGMISFPKNLSNVLLQSKILNFKDILSLTSNGKVEYVNTEKQKLKAIIPLSQWLSADINIDKDDAIINLKFNNYEISVSDGSAISFCNRVKNHPLISAAVLGNHFDFGNEIKMKPNLDYFCFWKVLKSDNGYKKYSNFINECNNKINVVYDEGKKYRCEFDGGKIDFQLLSIGDKYPKKVILQVDEIKDIEIIQSLQKLLNFRSIELLCKVSNLKLSTTMLLKKLKFYKDDDFFIFTSVRDNLRAEYDIASSILNVKQEFHINDNLDKEFLESQAEKTKEWVLSIIDNHE